MNEHIAATVAEGGLVPSPFTLETCPGCAGAVVLKDNGAGGVEEVCEVCGPIAWLFVETPREDNPKPPNKKDIGIAPMPLGFESWFAPAKVEMVEKCSSP